MILRKPNQQELEDIFRAPFSEKKEEHADFHILKLYKANVEEHGYEAI